MTEQTLKRITKEAEEKYRLLRINFEILEFGDEHPEYNKEYAKLEHNVKQESKIEGYIAGATAEAERSEKLRECLQEAKLQIEYLHDKFGSTGTGVAVWHKINSALNESK